MDLHLLQVSSKTTWDSSSLSKLDIRLDKQLRFEFTNIVGFEVFINARPKAMEAALSQVNSFRVVKSFYAEGTLFSFFTNSIELLPLYCNTNRCFSALFCCFTATPAFYPFICSLIRSWLTVSLTIVPTQCLGYQLRFHSYSFFVNAS